MTKEDITQAVMQGEVLVSYQPFSSGILAAKILAALGPFLAIIAAFWAITPEMQESIIALATVVVPLIVSFVAQRDRKGYESAIQE